MEGEKKQLRLEKGQLGKALKIFSFIKPYKWAFIFGLVLLIVSSLLVLVFPEMAGEMADIAAGEGTYGITLKEAGFILLILTIVQGIVSYFRVRLFVYVSENSLADIRKAVYKKMISLPITFFEKNRVGELLSRMTSDVTQLQQLISITIAEFLRQILILIVGITYIIISFPKLALVMLTTFPVIMIGAIFFGRFIKKLSKARQKELAKTNVVVEETLQNISVVKSFTNEFYENLRYGSVMNALVKAGVKLGNIRAIFGTFIIVALFGSIFFILWYGYNLVESGDMTVGQLIKFIAFTGFIGGG
ncbi:MAG: ABC transporter transmembrane domain-containing protein, partial [Bacteroidota bacterium]